MYKPGSAARPGPKQVSGSSARALREVSVAFEVSVESRNPNKWSYIDGWKSNDSARKNEERSERTDDLLLE